MESSSEDEHTKHLEIFSNLRAAINPSKFGKTKLTFLDHHINATGTSHSSKTVAILQFPVPSNMKGLWQFLSMAIFYCCFIPNCASIIQPVTNLLSNVKKNCDIIVSGDVLTTFSNINAALLKTVELACPSRSRFAFSSWHQYCTNWCSVTRKFLLAGNLFHSFSKMLTSTQHRYSTFGRELCHCSSLQYFDGQQTTCWCIPFELWKIWLFAAVYLTLDTLRTLITYQ